MKKILEPLETKGSLDRLIIENGKLQLGGWVASTSLTAVDSFKVSIAGIETSEFELVYGLPRPDLKKHFPGLHNIERAGFRIQVPLSQEEPAIAPNSLITITPLVNKQEGCILLNLLNPTIPPPSEESISSIGGNIKIAFEFLGYFIQRVGLEPTDNVLDVGCGIGRMAYALAHYLNSETKYEGFDITDKMLQWARQEITPRYPNFKFRLADIYNKLYNPNGKVKVEEFNFPYQAESFDFTFLTSVFTHIQGQGVRHYLNEIYRVLKPGGCCLCTCFLLNQESESLIKKGKSSQTFTHAFDDCFSNTPKVPEGSIAFKENLLRQWIIERGFTIEKVYYGNWCGRTDFVSYQDIVILHK